MSVFAMYDIRGKQEFIFRSRSLKEIVGGSAIIRDCFSDYLFPAAEAISEKGIYHGETAFSEAAYKEHLEEGYIGEVVYEGGGNFLLLMKDEKTFKDVTYEFTKRIMKNVGTLKVLGTCIEVDNFDDYLGDRKRLYEAHRKNEYKENGVMPWGTLPVVQVDQKTSFPLTDMRWDANKKERVKLSRESNAKYEKYSEELKKQAKDQYGVLVLDQLVEEKGKDSLLAVLYIDGNNMGYKVQECCKGLKSYEDCVRALRAMSQNIQKNYIDDRKINMDCCLKEKYGDSPSKKSFRLVLGAGDEINIICNAHDAFSLAVNYLSNLPEGESSCAGIAVFHSHAPYSDVYRIAEECCESGKRCMKENELSDVSLLDFHYCQGAIDVSLEQIRERESEDDISRPWLITGTSAGKIEVLDTIMRMKAFLNELGRSNVKGLASAAKSSCVELDQELSRIHAHMSLDKKEKMEDVWRYVYAMDADRRRRLIYDLVIVYDLWFKN